MRRGERRTRRSPEPRALLLLRSLTLLLLALTALAAQGCSGSVASTDAVRIAVIGNVDSLSPIYNRSTEARSVQKALFRGFLEWCADGRLRTEWASSVPSRDLKTFRGNAQTAFYTLHLRGDAKWSDGTPVTYDDFMFTYRLLLHPLFKKGHTWWTSFIRGFTLAGDSITFQVDRSPTHDSLDLFPLPHQLLEGSLNTDALHFADLPFNTTPVGDGPYKLKRRTYNSVQLERNDLFAPRPGKLSRVVFQYYANADDAWSAINRNKADVIEDLPLDSLSNAADNGQVKVELTPGPRLVTLVFNTRKAPFDDLHARRALAHCAERALLTQALGRELAFPTQSWIQPTRFSYIESFAGYRGDLDAAKRSLAASHWGVVRGRLAPSDKPPSGTDDAPPVSTEVSKPSAAPPAEPSGAPSAEPSGAASAEPSGGPSAEPSPTEKPAEGAVEVSILFDSDSADMQTAAISLQKSWKRLGLHVTLIGRPRPSYLAELRQGAFVVALHDLEVYPWTEPAVYFAEDSIPSSGNNFRGDNMSGWKAPQNKTLLSRIAAESSPAAAAPLVREQERLLSRDVPIVPLYFTPLATAYREGLTGLAPRTFGGITWNVEEWSWK